tara:strand:- start:27 stop:623 length:597 start_codon:yes stop_codon:yes gene_type:complete
MRLIAHRINSISKLKETNTEFGVEIDIRSFNNKLIIHHDAFESGEILDEWLEYYNHNILILNVKEEGLEERILELISKHKITNYFFLDQSFPFLIKLSSAGNKNTAVRFSEYESIKTVLSLSNKVDWVWVDCFSLFPLTKDIFMELKSSGFKICIVSPELQGRNSDSEVAHIVEYLKKNDIEIDAVCSKKVELWNKLI